MKDYRYLETGLETRTDQVIMRVTTAEKKLLFTEAQKLGISISAFIRLLLNGWMAGKTTIKHEE